jgi:hypothetical protein
MQNRRSLWSAVVRYRFGSQLQACCNNLNGNSSASLPSKYTKSRVTTKAVPNDTAGKLEGEISWILAPSARNVYRTRQAIIPSSGGATYTICRSSGAGKLLGNDFYKHSAPTALRNQIGCQQYPELPHSKNSVDLCAPSYNCYSIFATPPPGLGNRVKTRGSCPGTISLASDASCLIRSCALRFDPASSVAAIAARCSRFS